MFVIEKLCSFILRSFCEKPLNSNDYAICYDYNINAFHCSQMFFFFRNRNKTRLMRMYVIQAHIIKILYLY